MKYRHLFLLLVLGVAAGLSAMPSINEILQKLEANYKMTSDASARVQMTQQKTGQGAKNMEMLWYRRDRDNAFMIVMTAPENEKGNGYLRMDDNFWMYRRNTRSFQHVSRDESIGGSDARGDDFESRNLTELYEGVKGPNGADSISEEMLGKMPVYRIVVKAKVNDVDYPRKISWVSRDQFLMLKEESYSNSGTLMQTAYYTKYTQVNGKFTPVKQIFKDEFEKGNWTNVEISNISTNKLDDAMFTKGYLENLSK